MLPYHRLQLAYAGLSLALTALVWWGAGRVAPPGQLLARSALALSGIGVLGLGLFALLKAAGNPVSGFFIAVALSFYAAGFWLPAFLVASALRGRNVRPISRAIAAGAAFAAPAICLYAMLVEPNRLQVREERVEIDAWPSGAEPVRVAHLSDLQTVGRCRREQVALEEVRRLAPDVIVITGDYVAGPFFDTGPAEEAAREFLASLCAIAPTMVVAGHSEGEDERRRVFEGLDLDYLQDRARDFDFGGGRKLRVAGLDPYRPDLRLPREERSPDTALIVATHSPDETLNLQGMGIDLHLAGHTHGGQIALPWIGAPVTLTQLPRQYARGLHRMGDHWMNVCAGLGMEGNHAPRVRLNCPPEICLLRLEGARREPAGGSD